MTLLSLPATSQTLPADIKLQKGAPAPFEGALLTRERYSYLRARDDIAERLETQAIETTVNAEKKPFFTPLVGALLGFVAGGIVIYATNPNSSNLVAFVGGAAAGGLCVLAFP